MPNDLTLEQIQALITRAPFHQWLGLTVVAATTTASRSRRSGARNGWSTPSAAYTHGGILAALIDLAADWAMVKQTGRGVPTIDLRVDYHRAAMPRRSHRPRQGGARSAANFPPPRRTFSTSTANSSPAAAAPISPRRRNPHDRTRTIERGLKGTDRCDLCLHFRLPLRFRPPPMRPTIRTGPIRRSSRQNRATRASSRRCRAAARNSSSRADRRCVQSAGLVSQRTSADAASRRPWRAETGRARLRAVPPADR